MLIRHRLLLLSALLFLAVSPGLRAQPAVSYERGKTQLEDILPASPEPASRVKYASVPFTQSLGSVVCSVPLWELKGSFIISPSHSVIQLQGPGVKIVPTWNSANKISCFTITGPDGTVYTFSCLETGTRQEQDVINPTIFSGQQADWDATTAYSRQPGVRENMRDKNAYQDSQNIVLWNPDNNQVGLCFISLGHELAHALDDMKGTKNNDVWISAYTYDLPHDVPFSEIFATHYENMIRAEHNINLRRYYLKDSNNNYTGPLVVDWKKRSMYYNSQGSTNYKVVRSKDRYHYKKR